jgi:hypothetical protein
MILHFQIFMTFCNIQQTADNYMLLFTKNVAMVQVQPRKSRGGMRKLRFILLRLLFLAIALYVCSFAEITSNYGNDGGTATSSLSSSTSNGSEVVHITTSTNTSEASQKKEESASSKIIHRCSYKSLADLKPFERAPVASKVADGNGRRHLVDPPKGGKVSLVCCDTTKGSMSIAVHHNWAPLGAKRFLEMVNDEYFSSKVAMMRCLKNFLCQFGIAGEPSLNRKYKSIQDDPNWLPKGPTHMTNEYGTKRYAKGYFAYAGA